MTAINESLLGERIIRAAAREFWLEQQLSCPCCPVLLEGEDQRCWRILYDDETYRWSIDTGKIPFPEIGSVVGDEEMEWRDVSLIGANKILGSSIIEIDRSETEDEARLVIMFDNGEGLMLSHKYSDDSSSFVISPAC